MTQYEIVEAKIDEIEAELKKTGAWEIEAPSESAFVDMGPFGMNTMAPQQWIKFVLIPQVRKIILDKGEFPPQSSLGAWAMKNLEGDKEEHLSTLLIEFNNLFEEKKE